MRCVCLFSRCTGVLGYFYVSIFEVMFVYDPSVAYKVIICKAQWKILISNECYFG